MVRAVVVGVRGTRVLGASGVHAPGRAVHAPGRADIGSDTVLTPALTPC